jgi:hypothetical protein
MQRGYEKLHDFRLDDRVEITDANFTKLNGMKGTVHTVDKAVLTIILDLGHPIQLHFTKVKHLDILGRMSELV